LLPTLKDKSYWVIAFPQIALLVFYLRFADIYYYLVLIIPFLILNLVYFIDRSSWTGGRNIQWALGLVVIVYLTSSSYRYLTGHARIDNVNQLDDVAQWVTDNSGPDDSIYGAAGITPLIALHSGAPITGHFVDTNQKTFFTGTVSMPERQKQLREQGIKYFITVLTGTKLLPGQVRQNRSRADYRIIDWRRTHGECHLSFRRFSGFRRFRYRFIADGDAQQRQFAVGIYVNNLCWH
jgi:hypothetical protein